MDYNEAQNKKRNLINQLVIETDIKKQRIINNKIIEIDLAITQAKKNGTLINAPKTLDQTYAKTVL